MLSSVLGEVAMRHTAGHELGHHVFGHGTVLDERVDPDAGILGAPLPDEEKLAEAFAAWFLMPLPAVRSAMRRSGYRPAGRPWRCSPDRVLAWHVVRWDRAPPGELAASGHAEAEEWNRAWRNNNGRIRAALCGSRTPPPGRVWVLGPGAHRTRLHVLPEDSLVYPGGELPDALPPGLAVRTEQQLSLEPRAVSGRHESNEPVLPADRASLRRGRDHGHPRPLRRCAAASTARGAREKNLHPLTRRKQ